MYWSLLSYFFSFIALFQPVAVGSREFEDVLKILHSSYLEPSSVSSFNYKRASLVHSELLEKEVSIFLASLYEEGTCQMKFNVFSESRGKDLDIIFYLRA